MVNLYVYCEGQTEESFVKSILSVHFLAKGVILFPIIHRTKEGPKGIFRGGITDYNRAVNEIRKICTQHPNEKITSFIDYYGLDKLPQTDCVVGDKYALISQIEEHFYQDVGCKNFIPYISLHEFESLLFAKPEGFSYLDKDAVRIFTNTVVEFNGNPELINNGAETAPSKRIKKEIQQYSKVLDGMIVAKQITLQEMRAKCKHFNKWITQLERL